MTDGIYQHHNEFDYRYIYLAYLTAGAPWRTVTLVRIRLASAGCE
ncbi:hypothetical protein ACX27O_15440 [Micromonospora sp. SD19]